MPEGTSECSGKVRRILFWIELASNMGVFLGVRRVGLQRFGVFALLFCAMMLMLGQTSAGGGSGISLDLTVKESLQSQAIMVGLLILIGVYALIVTEVVHRTLAAALGGLIAVGAHVGSQMEGGVIMIRGDAGKAIGSGMKDGLIVVHGDVGSDPGTGMSGGKIVITLRTNGEVVCHNQQAECHSWMLCPC